MRAPVNNVVVVGGAGFIGSHLVARLAGRGIRITVPTRRRMRARHLILLPTVDVVETDVSDDRALDRLLVGREALINLAGVLHSARGHPYGKAFRHAHVDLPRRLVDACAHHGVTRFLHMSALGADSAGPSMYQRSKGDGEAIVQASGLNWTIFRPSVVFGPEDRFLNLFAKLARWFPVLPIGNAEARFQPVWVGDVAEAFANTLDNPATFGRIYELAGPEIYTLRELVEFAATASGRPRRVVALPAALARLQAAVMEWAPGQPLLSRDNLDSMRVDNIATEQPYVPAPELGIEPTPMPARAAAYLAGVHPRERFGTYRARARR